MRRVCVEEQPALGGHGRVLAEQVLQHAQARALRVHGLRDVRQLQRVAEQDQVARRGARGERIGERELAGLVDHEVVELLVGVARARTARSCRRRARTPARSRPARAADALRAPVRRAGAPPPLPCARPLKSTPSSSAARSISASRLLIALWLIAVTPTRLPRAIRSTIRRAPSQVLPVPGRALDDERALVERARQPARLREIGRLDRCAREHAREPRRRVREHVLQRAERGRCRRARRWRAAAAPRAARRSRAARRGSALAAAARRASRPSRAGSRPACRRIVDRRRR